MHCEDHLCIMYILNGLERLLSKGIRLVVFSYLFLIAMIFKDDPNKMENFWGIKSKAKKIHGNFMFEINFVM